MKRLLTVVFLFYAIPLLAQWSQQVSPIAPSYGTIHFFDSNNGWAFGASGSVKTNNAGANWTNQSTNYGFKKVSVVNQLTAYALVGDKSIYKTTDGGLIWVQCTTPAWAPAVTTLDGIAFVSSTIGYVGGTNGYIFKTINGGNAWSLVSSGGFYVSDLFFLDANNGFASRWGGQWSKTADGGATWSGGVNGANNFYSIFALDANNIFIAGANGTVYKTVNGGTNWTLGSTNTNEILYDVYATSTSTVWASGANGTIIQSTDGANTWAPQASGITQTIKGLFFVNANLGWAVGEGGKILKYTGSGSITVTAPNGGENWLVGSNQNITWSSSNITNVKLEYSIDNGSNWTQIVASTAAGVGTFVWTVPNSITTQALVRITDAADNTITDKSNSVFRIYTKAITVISPNGGEKWISGTTKRIEWNSSNVANVKIEYSSDNGTNWNQIVNSGTASLNFYDWVVPQEPAVNYLVRITDVVDASVSDVSNNKFTVPALKLFTPAGGERWLVNTWQVINWTSVGVQNAVLRYRNSQMAPNTWTNVSWVTANSGLFQWKIPNDVSENTVFQIIDAEEPLLFSESPKFAIVAPMVTLTAPNGGENWLVGSNQNIIWTSSNVANVKIEYSVDNGTNWTQIVASTGAAAGTYSWAIPNAPSTNCKVRISDAAEATVNDVSNNVFTIYQKTVTVTSPNGGENWFTGSHRNITWTSVGVTNVWLRYRTGNMPEGSWTTIGTTSANIGSYDWTVPNDVSTNCLVQIIGDNDFSVIDQSDASFTIRQPALNITSPNGGEEWNIGKSYQIKWTSNFSSMLTIYYSINNGQSWIEIARDVNSEQETFSWVIPNAETNQGLIKVESQLYTSANDQSNSAFKIIAGPIAHFSFSPLGKILCTDRVLLNASLSSHTSPIHAIVRYEWDFNVPQAGVVNPDPVQIALNFQVESQGKTISHIYTDPGIYFPVLKVIDDQGRTDYYWQRIVIDPGSNLIIGSSNELNFYQSSIATLPVLNYPFGQFKISPNCQGSELASVTITLSGNTNHFTGINPLRLYASAINNFNTATPIGNDASVIGQNVTFSNMNDEIQSDRFYWVTADLGDTFTGTLRGEITGSANIVLGNGGGFTNQTNYGMLDKIDFQITFPNGGEEWITNSVRKIRWVNNSVGNTAIGLDFTTDDGNTWIEIVRDINASQLEYDWLIPNTPSANCRIRIRNMSNAILYDISDEKFTIIGRSIIVNAPSGGENWLIGSSHDISWSAENVAQVKIEYSTDNGTTWSLIIDKINATPAIYNWTIPNSILVVSKNCLIRISDSGNPAIIGESSNSFIISVLPVASFQNTADNYCERPVSFDASSSYSPAPASSIINYEWDFDVSNINNQAVDQNIIANNFTVDAVGVQLSHTYDTGTYYAALRITSDFGNVAYSWKQITVRPILNFMPGSWRELNFYQPSVDIFPGTNIPIGQFKINSICGTDELENVTVILTGNSSQLLGNTPFRLYGSNQNNFISALPIGADVAHVGQSVVFSNLNDAVLNTRYYWITVDFGSDYIGTLRATINNTSDIRFNKNSFLYGTFGLLDKERLLLISPNGGESFIAGTTNNITWNYSSVSYTNIKIEYSIDNGTTWNTITNSWPIAYKTYTWSVPSNPSSQCLVRISNPAVPQDNDVSNNVFTILPPKEITVTSPTGGENWRTGSSQNIIWSSTNVNEVSIQYMLNNSGVWNLIAERVPAEPRNFRWLIPNNLQGNCIIRVASPNLDVSSISNYFTISTEYTIQVLSPNDDEDFLFNTMNDITWQTNLSGNVNIYYSLNGGNRWTTIANVPANPGRYAWRVNSNSSPNAKIKISNSDNTIYDESDSSFTINSLYLTSPVGSEEWYVGTPHEIKWHYAFTTFDNLKIQYSTNNGNSWKTIADNTPLSAKMFSWIVPNSPTEQCKIRISKSTDSLYAYVSLRTFKISSEPFVMLTSPNGGEQWLFGTNQKITWNSSNVANVKLEYSTDNGVTWQLIIASTPASSAEFSWRLPNIENSNCKIRIKDVSRDNVFDISDNSFTISRSLVNLIYPNGGEKITAASRDSIKWDFTNAVTLKLYYSTNNGVNWTGIDFNVNAAAKKYIWTVPSVSSTNCLVKIKDANNASTDSSMQVFTIASLRIVSPNGGELLQAGSSHTITWTSQNVGLSKIQLTANNGLTWTDVATNLNVDANGNGRYNWTLPLDVSSSNCRVRIVENSSQSVNDQSDNTFAITNSSVIVLTSPVGGEKLYIGRSYEIKWQSTNIQTLRIEYSSDNGVNWNIITSNAAANAGKYVWQISNINPGDYRIKISDKFVTSTYDAGQNFRISLEPVIILLKPNSAVSLTATKMYDITWQSTNVLNVDIYVNTDVGGARSSWQLVASAVPAADGKYTWKIPLVSSAKCKIKLVDHDETDISVSSTNYFTITIPPIIIRTPNGNENLEVGSITPISWYAVKTIGKVKIYYSVNRGKRWTSIKEVEANDETFNWAVPNSISNNCLIKISDASNSENSDVSDTTFSINNSNLIKWVHQSAPPDFVRGSPLSVYSFSFINEQLGFAATSNGVIKTTDGGQNWQIPAYTEYRERGNNNYYYTYPNMYGVSFINPNEGYAAGNNGKIIKTTDSGTTWSEKNLGTSASLRVCRFIDSNTGYVAGNGGAIYKTVNGGNSWITLNSGISSDIKSMFFINQSVGWITSTSGRILKTIDGGTSWTQQQSNLTFDLNGIYMIDSNLGFIVGNDGKVLKTTNSGSNWNILETGSTSTLKAVSFLNSSNGIAAGSGGTILLTNNGGNTWSPQESNTSSQLNAAAYIGINSIWAGGENETIRKNDYIYLTLLSPNGGETLTLGQDITITWSAHPNVEKVKIGFITPSGNMLSETTVFSANTGSAVIKMSGRVTQKGKFVISSFYDSWLKDSSDAFIKTISSDNASWRNSYYDENIGYGNYTISSVFSTDAQHIWFSTENSDNSNIGYLYRTVDGGSNWIKGENRQFRANQLFFLNNSIGWASKGSSISPMKTSDGGQTWNYLDILPTRGDMGFSNVCFTSETEGWNANTGSIGLWKTTNGGLNWTSNYIQISARQVKFKNNYGIAFGWNNYILRTTDRGTNWQINQLSSFKQPMYEDAFILNENVGWICGWGVENNDRRFGIIKKTINKGETWRDQLRIENKYYTAICFSNENIGFVADGNKLLKTTDGGTSWSLNTTLGNNIISIISASQNTWWVFDDGGNVLYTNNAGGFSQVYKTAGENVLPTEYSVSQNYPNPFNPVTTIEFSLANDSKVRIQVYNSIGELVSVLVDNIEAAGLHNIKWDGTDLSSGVYILKFDAESMDNGKKFRKMLKMLLLK